MRFTRIGWRATIVAMRPGISIAPAWLLGALALVRLTEACDPYGEDAVAPAPHSSSDGGPDDGAVVDGAASDARGSCDPTAPFTKIAQVPGLLGGVGSFSATDDELLTVASLRLGDSSFGVFELTRSTADAAFSVRRQVNELGAMGSSALSGDGLTIVFSSARTGQALIYVATRNSRDELFGDPQPIPTIAPAATQGVTTLRSDALWMFREESNGTYMVYSAARGPNGFSAPTPITEIDGDDDDVAPVVSSDGLVMHFASERGFAGLSPSTYRVYRAVRSAPGTKFANLVRVEDLDEAGGTTQIPAWTSPDHCRLYVLRYDFDAGDNNLLVASR